jgi:hypothetical protein
MEALKQKGQRKTPFDSLSLRGFYHEKNERNANPGQATGKDCH